MLKSHPKPLGMIKMDKMEGVGLTGPCLWLGLLAVSRSLSPKFKKHLEFGHVNNVDHLNASPRTFYVTCGYTLEYHVEDP
jgi:hypothetical protein